MSEKHISISVAKLASVVSIIGGSGANPNPDDPGDPNNPFGPFGPGGPVIRGKLGVGVVRSVALSRAFINSVVTVKHVTMMMQKEFREQANTSVKSQIADFVDDWCGTGWPHHWPWPFPFPPGPDPDPNPVYLVAAGLQFYNAAKSAGDLSGAFNDAASKLIETGVAQMG